MTKLIAVAASVFVLSGWTGVVQAGGDTKIPIDPTVTSRGVARDGGKVGVDPGVTNRGVARGGSTKERAPKSTIKQKVVEDRIGNNRGRTGVDPQGTEAQGVEQ